MAEQDDSLTLARIAQIIRRFWLIILILTLFGAAGAFGIAKAQTPIYQADSSVYFSLRQGDTSSDLNQGSAYTQAQMLSFAQLATEHITLERVITDLGLDTTSANLARNITVTSPQNTVILNISVSSTSATRAASIANSVATNLSHVVVELAPTDSSANATVSAKVVDPAVVPRVQSAPNKSRDTAIGGLLGLLVGIVGCVLFTRLDTRVRSVEAVASLTESPVLGQIGRLQPSPDQRPMMLRAPNGEEAESFRRARAGLRFASIDKDVRVILVTSGIPAEGKTTVSVNLALAMAETNARVLLIDADLRRPRVATALSLEGAIGLTTVLVDDVSLDEARRPYNTTSLDLLLSGDVPPNPSELLSSERMAQIIAELSAEYDLVIVDTAPVLSVADATLLAPHVDLVLLVVDASRIRKAQLAKCIRALEVTGAHISGIVLNRMKISKRRDDYYYGAIDGRESGANLLRRRLRGADGRDLSPASAEPRTASAAVPELSEGAELDWRSSAPEQAELDSLEWTSELIDPADEEREPESDDAPVKAPPTEPAVIAEPVEVSDPQPDAPVKAPVRRATASRSTRSRNTAPKQRDSTRE